MNQANLNPQQEAVALWKFLESRGFAPSMNSIARTLRDQGLKFRNADLWEWLDKFAGAHPGRKRGEVRARNSSTPGAVEAQVGRSQGAPTRANKEPLISDGFSEAAPLRSALQEKLGLGDAIETAAGHILDAIWPLVAERVKPSMTKTAWRKRNKATAADFARASVPVDRIIAAHADLSQRRGDVVYTLRFVQDHLVRTSPKVALAGAVSVAGKQPAWLTTAIDRGKGDADHRTNQLRSAS